MPPPRRHKLFFWILLAAYSTFFAEVFAGSDMFPFLPPAGAAVRGAPVRAAPARAHHPHLPLRQAARWRGASAPPSFPATRALLGIGLVFAVLLPGGKILLDRVAAPILVAGWLAVALFETWALSRAVREVRS